MALLTWNASYSVNVKSCDAEHQKLFSLINKLHDAMKAGQGRMVLGDIVRELGEYTQIHFSAEEALMQHAQYEKLQDHRLQHRLFIEQVATVQKGSGSRCRRFGCGSDVSQELVVDAHSEDGQDVLFLLKRQRD